MNGVRCSLAEAASILDKTPAGLRKLFERERERTGAREVCVNGVHAIRRGRHRWIVTIGDPWLVDGRVARWSALEDAARRFGVAAATLRRQLERNQRNNRDGVTSTYKGHAARKLGALWLVQIESATTKSRGACAGATAP